MMSYQYVTNVHGTSTSGGWRCDLSLRGQVSIIGEDCGAEAGKDRGEFTRVAGKGTSVLFRDDGSERIRVAA